ncbi:MAG: hypothetical protein GWN62_25085 [Aliifodinibius sp.]|nr:hypothetical protein [Fodinibius sp.]
MASVKMIPKKRAVGKAKWVYREIKIALRIDGVPNLHKSFQKGKGFWNRKLIEMVLEKLRISMRGF